MKFPTILRQRDPRKGQELHSQHTELHPKRTIIFKNWDDTNTFPWCKKRIQNEDQKRDNDKCKLIKNYSNLRRIFIILHPTLQHRPHTISLRYTKCPEQRLRWSRGSTQVRRFKPGRSHQDFSGRKNPQHASFRKGSKAVGPMSQICGM